MDEQCSPDAPGNRVSMYRGEAYWWRGNSPIPRSRVTITIPLCEPYPLVHLATSKSNTSYRLRWTSPIPLSQVTIISPLCEPYGPYPPVHLIIRYRTKIIGWMRPAPSNYLDSQQQSLFGNSYRHLNGIYFP